MRGEIVYKGGHSEVIHAEKRHIDEQRVQAEKRICWECERKVRAVEARRIAESRGLPPLKGTPKQVAWAEQLRLKAMQEVEELEERVLPEAQALWNKYRRILCAQQEAAYWIDQRFVPVQERFVRWVESSE